MPKIYRGEQFNNLKLNPSVKSREGFITSMLEALYDRCIESREMMAKPYGFHLLLTQVDKSKLHYIPRIIARWAERRNKCPLSYMTGKYHFVKAEEIRPIKREFHIHLQFICDSITFCDIQSLKEALYIVAKKTELKNRSDKYRPIMINPITGECLTDPKTGEVLRKGCKWRHDLNGEFEDYFERASYICKVKTKVSLYSWSCSKLVKTTRTHPTYKYRKMPSTYVRAKPKSSLICFNQDLTSFSQLQSRVESNQEAYEIQLLGSEFGYELDQVRENL